MNKLEQTKSLIKNELISEVVDGTTDNYVMNTEKNRTRCTTKDKWSNESTDIMDKRVLDDEISVLNQIVGEVVANFFTRL